MSTSEWISSKSPCLKGCSTMPNWMAMHHQGSSSTDLHSTADLWGSVPIFNLCLSRKVPSEDVVVVRRRTKPSSNHSNRHSVGSFPVARLSLLESDVLATDEDLAGLPQRKISEPVRNVCERQPDRCRSVTIGEDCAHRAEAVPNGKVVLRRQDNPNRSPIKDIWKRLSLKHWRKPAEKGPDRQRPRESSGWKIYEFNHVFLILLCWPLLMAASCQTPIWWPRRSPQLAGLSFIDSLGKDAHLSCIIIAGGAFEKPSGCFFALYKLLGIDLVSVCCMGEAPKQRSCQNSTVCNVPAIYPAIRYPSMMCVLLTYQLVSLLLSWYNPTIMMIMSSISISVGNCSE